MVQIITSKVNDPVDGEVIAVDPEDASKGTFTHYVMALNEVVMKIPSGRVASVVGADIRITKANSMPDSIMEGGNTKFNILDVDSVPADWEPNGYIFDGTTWTKNPNYPWE